MLSATKATAVLLLSVVLASNFQLIAADETVNEPKNADNTAHDEDFDDDDLSEDDLLDALFDEEDDANLRGGIDAPSGAEDRPSAMSSTVRLVVPPASGKVRDACFYTSLGGKGQTPHIVQGSFRRDNFPGSHHTLSIFAGNHRAFHSAKHFGNFVVRVEPRQFLKFCVANAGHSSKSAPHDALDTMAIEWQWQSSSEQRSQFERAEREKQLIARHDYLTGMAGAFDELIAQSAAANAQSAHTGQFLAAAERQILLITTITQFIIFWNAMYFLYNFYQVFKQRIVC